MEYKVLNFEVCIDFKANYGDRFEFLNAKTPISVLLAEGSNITVENKKTIT